MVKRRPLVSARRRLQCLRRRLTDHATIAVATPSARRRRVRERPSAGDRRHDEQGSRPVRRDDERGALPRLLAGPAADVRSDTERAPRSDTATWSPPIEHVGASLTCWIAIVNVAAALESALPAAVPPSWATTDTAAEPSHWRSVCAESPSRRDDGWDAARPGLSVMTVKPTRQRTLGSRTRRDGRRPSATVGLHDPRERLVSACDGRWAAGWDVRRQSRVDAGGAGDGAGEGTGGTGGTVAQASNWWTGGLVHGRGAGLSGSSAGAVSRACSAQRAAGQTTRVGRYAEHLRCALPGRDAARLPRRSSVWTTSRPVGSLDDSGRRRRTCRLGRSSTAACGASVTGHHGPVVATTAATPPSAAPIDGVRGMQATRACASARADTTRRIRPSGCPERAHVPGSVAFGDHSSARASGYAGRLLVDREDVIPS